MEYIIADLRISLPDDLVTSHFGRALAHFAVATPSERKPATDTAHGPCTRGPAHAEAPPQTSAAATPFPEVGVPGSEPARSADPMYPADSSGCPEQGGKSEREPGQNADPMYSADSNGCPEQGRKSKREPGQNADPMYPADSSGCPEQERKSKREPGQNADPMYSADSSGCPEQGPDPETEPAPDSERVCFPETTAHTESSRPDLVLRPGTCPPPGDAYREIDRFDFTDADAECRFGRDAAGYLLEMSPRDGSAPARFRMRPGSPEVTTDYTLGHHPALLRFGLWTACNIAALDRLSVAIHSSVILHRGQAILFLGESGTGKSTHTRLWREHIAGAELLNDDSPIVRVASEKTSPKQRNDHPGQVDPAEDRTSVVAHDCPSEKTAHIGQTPDDYPENHLHGQTHDCPAEDRTSGQECVRAGLTPGNARLSAVCGPATTEETSECVQERAAQEASESTSRKAPEETSSSNEAPGKASEERPVVLACGSPWSGKTPCYRNECYPVRAFVRLSQAPYNRIRRLRPLEAIGALLPSCPPAFAHDKELFDRVCATVSAMLSRVEVYRLECLPDAEAARLVCKTLFADEVDRQ